MRARERDTLTEQTTNAASRVSQFSHFSDFCQDRKDRTRRSVSGCWQVRGLAKQQRQGIRNIQGYFEFVLCCKLLWFNGFKTIVKKVKKTLASLPHSVKFIALDGTAITPQPAASDTNPKVMTKIKSLIAELKDNKGASRNARIVSTVAPLAKFKGMDIQKVTELTVVSGVSFGNRKDIKEAIEAGERGEVQPLPWGEWVQFPFHIAHKGQDYIRLYLPSQEQQAAGFQRETVVKFFASGVEISREQAIAFCGSKAEAKANESGCMTVKADGVTIL